MEEEKQQFVDATFAEQCADALGGAFEYDPLQDNSHSPVMDDPEPVYIWDPETDNYYLEQCNSMRQTSKV